MKSAEINTKFSNWSSIFGRKKNRQSYFSLACYNSSTNNKRWRKSWYFVCRVFDSKFLIFVVALLPISERKKISYTLSRGKVCVLIGIKSRRRKNNKYESCYAIASLAWTFLKNHKRITSKHYHRLPRRRRRVVKQSCVQKKCYDKSVCSKIQKTIQSETQYISKEKSVLLVCRRVFLIPFWPN